MCNRQVIDLRMLAASAMQGERTYFSKILFIPPRPTVLLQKELAAQAEGGEVRRNMLAAKVCAAWCAPLECSVCMQRACARWSPGNDVELEACRG